MFSSAEGSNNPPKLDHFFIEPVKNYESVEIKKDIEISKIGKSQQRKTVIKKPIISNKKKLIHSPDSSNLSKINEFENDLHSVVWIASSKKLKSSILEALSSYSGPLMKITSGHRHWGGKGHKAGRAIDIHYTEDIADFLDSEQGQEWLTAHHLEFFIEDKKKSTKDNLPERFHQYWRHIPWATNIHIHINELNYD